jgi:hypothetical protein
MSPEFFALPIETFGFGFDRTEERRRFFFMLLLVGFPFFSFLLSRCIGFPPALGGFLARVALPEAVFGEFATAERRTEVVASAFLGVQADVHERPIERPASPRCEHDDERDHDRERDADA